MIHDSWLALVGLILTLLELPLKIFNNFEISNFQKSYHKQNVFETDFSLNGHPKLTKITNRIVNSRIYLLVQNQSKLMHVKTIIRRERILERFIRALDSDLFRFLEFYERTDGRACKFPIDPFIPDIHIKHCINPMCIQLRPIVVPQTRWF